MIPVVVTPPPQPPSAEAKELAELLTLSIQEFQRRNPDTSKTDVQVALRLTAQNTVPTNQAATMVAVALLLAGVLAALVVGFLVRKGEPQSFVMPIALGVGVLGAMVGILFVAKRRG